MTRTWKCLLGAVAVCALLNHAADAEVIEGDDVGVVRVQPTDPNPVEPANSLYGEQEQIWLDDFQPPPGYGIDPVTAPKDGKVGYAVTSNVEDILYRIDRVNRHYHGLDGGWTGVNAFVPMRTFSGGTSLFALDSRAFVSDYGRGGLNLGFVGRHYFSSRNSVLGVSAWYDYDQAHRVDYSQLGLHASWIGPYWSMRGNIQVPVGQSHERYGKVVTPSFNQDLLILQVASLQETAYQQYDFEFALPVPYFARYGFEFGIGYYYLNGATHGVEDGNGLSTRFESQLTEDMWLNAFLTHDNVFGSNLSINLQVTLPNGPPSRFLRRLPPRQYLVASDKRPYRVLAKTTNVIAQKAALSPVDHNPIQVAHIDPNPFVSAQGAPLGTFENPFPSVAAFDGLPNNIQSQYDIILVRGRNDGTDTNLNTTVTLFDYQQLLGTGVSHFIDTAIGRAPLPDLPYGTPVLSNSGAPGIDVVTLADMNVVSGLTIDATDTANAINGLDVADHGVRGFDINRNLIRRAIVGVDINVDNTVRGEPIIGRFTENTVELTSDDGLRVAYNGVGTPPDTLDLTVRDNLFQGILGKALNVDLSGTAVASLDITDNYLNLLQQNQFVTGLNFVGQSSSVFDGFPPDTQGAVGPNQIVELLNIGYAVYDKNTGALIDSKDTLDDFWTDAGAVIPVGSFLSDPRIIYDPTVHRFFAVAIDVGISTAVPGPNNIYVAVSNSDNPADGWKAFSFVADTVTGTRLADYPTLGVDADGLYIATNNFDFAAFFTDVSIYSIPKADLVGPTPNINNLSRFENLNATGLGHGVTLQPVVDFGPSDGTQILATENMGGGNVLVQTDLNGTAGANPTLSLGTQIPVAPYFSIGVANTPGFFVDALDARFGSNVVKVGDSIWAVHNIFGDPLTSAGNILRWYQIDANTHALLQTGDITDPNIEFIAPSIAVNDRNQVVIGFTGTGTTQFPSSYAAIGQTVNGVTTFGSPVLLARGDADYFNFRWGDYSATVVDPSSRNQNVFWTFQERTLTQDSQFAIQITQLIGGLGGNDGIFVTARDDAQVLAGSEISRNLIDGSVTGITVNAFDNALIDLSQGVNDNIVRQFEDYAIGFNTADNGTILLEFDRNVGANGSGTGAIFNLDGGTIDVVGSINNNNFSGNGEFGMSIINNLGGLFTTPGIANNDFSNNTEAGLFIGGDGPGPGLSVAINDLGQVTMNNFERGLAGVESIRFDSSDVFTRAIFTLNSFAGGNPNAGIGIGGTVTGDQGLTPMAAGVDLQFLTPAGLTPNVFVSNIDANIGLIMAGFTQNNIVIQQHDLSNVVDGANPLFDGDGAAFRLENAASLNGVVQRSRFRNNEGSGLRFDVFSTGTVNFAHIDSLLIGHASNVALGNEFTGNGIDGLQITRQGSGEIGTVTPVGIFNNLFENNTRDGFRLTAAGRPFPFVQDRYTIINNLSQNNGGSGAHLRVEADASLLSNIDRNSFINNTLDGIQTSEQVNSPNDLRNVTGTWTRNILTGNGRDGINLDGGFSALVIGDASDTLLGNLIENNAEDGIGVTAPGDGLIGSNQIVANGNNGPDDAGIDIHSRTSLDLTLQNNFIGRNRGDGIEVDSDGQFLMALNVLGNVIQLNDGRGFDLLAQPNAMTDSSDTGIVYNDNFLDTNLLEAVYIVFTASTTQTQDVASTVALNADGSIDATPRLRFDMDGNQIVGNGRGSQFTSTGVVVRVGTTDAPRSAFDPTNIDRDEFASDGFGNFVNSGVIMSMTNNSLSGNFGADIYFESFASTVDPPTTAGTWDNTPTFTITPPYRGDPLARLDLVFDNNAFDAADPTNTGAFYNNAEGTFKSRLNTANPPGPFTSATRRRNAQRVAARIPTFLAPAFPGGTFMYPGLGPSTFRVRGNAFQLMTAGFVLDNAPYTTTFDANGVFLPGSIIGELPYGWGAF